MQPWNDASFYIQNQEPWVLFNSLDQAPTLKDNLPLGLLSNNPYEMVATSEPLGKDASVLDHNSSFSSSVSFSTGKTDDSTCFVDNFIDLDELFEFEEDKKEFISETNQQATDLETGYEVKDPIDYAYEYYGSNTFSTIHAYTSSIQDAPCLTTTMSEVNSKAHITPTSSIQEEEEEYSSASSPCFTQKSSMSNPIFMDDSADEESEDEFIPSASEKKPKNSLSGKRQPIPPKRKKITNENNAPKAIPLTKNTLIQNEKSSEKKRRNQVKVACIHCKKACKKCDEVRPCSRCVRLDIAGTCVDAPRKERKKGFKRGPYNRKNSDSEDNGNSEAFGYGSHCFYPPHPMYPYQQTVVPMQKSPLKPKNQKPKKL